MDKALQDKISRLQSMEQNVQQYVMRRQQFSQQLMEIESALKELESSPEAYKIVGNIMVKTSKDQLKKELAERKELADMRIQSLDKQEQKVAEKVEELKKEVMAEIKKAK
ncbi:MAG TPA: prefoldin subunit beta [Candidatus Nanoarchaeia archaeon]|nr:prefoldin subunit beta [Candidatus Nanoarchaeia archaeon]